MEAVNYRESNIDNLLYLDSMIWIDCLDDPNLYSKVDAQIIEENYDVLIHSNLGFELFNPRFSQEFETIWSMIENRAWTNFSPIEMIYNEIAAIIYGENLERTLQGRVFYLGTREKVFHKNQFTNDSAPFYERKALAIAAENFIKISRQHQDEKNLDMPFLDALSAIKNNIARGAAHDFSFFDKNIGTFFKKKIITAEIEDATKAIIGELKAIDDSEFLAEMINKMRVMLLSGVNISETFKLRDFDETDYLFTRASEAHGCNFFGDIPLNLVLSELSQYSISDFPGLRVVFQTSKFIRKSQAKAKPSDQIDYLNLVYLPYCKKYVTDGHISDVIKQLFPEYRHIAISKSDYLREIKAV